MELILDVIFLIGAIAGLLGATWSLRAQYRANRALFYRMCAAAGGYFAYFAFGVLGVRIFRHTRNQPSGRQLVHTRAADFADPFFMGYRRRYYS
jgi:hypothetical protein